MTATDTAAPTFERRSTDQLVEGDVVWTHGMRLVLGPVDSRVRECGSAGERRVYWSVGRITNPAEVRKAGVVPHSWVKDGTWTVQGNDLAVWCVEVTA